MYSIRTDNLADDVRVRVICDNESIQSVERALDRLIEVLSAQLQEN